MKLDLDGKTCLVLAPHTDDGELGCGGTINKLVRQGARVHYVAFSTCEGSVPDGFEKNVLSEEVMKATKILGISPEDVTLLRYEVRTFGYKRQEILDDMIVIKKRIEPDIVFIPSLGDVHQDHGVIANEAVRAFKFTTLLCYELPWNNFDFNTTLFVGLSEENVQAKAHALAQYRSQSHRSYAQDDFIRSLAKVRGVQCGLEYAEVFETVRIVND